MDTASEPEHKAVRAGLWSRVTVQDGETHERIRVTIVPVEAADPSAGKVSVGAPLAAALMGRQAGECVRVGVHEGDRVFRILHVALDEAEPEGRGL